MVIQLSEPLSIMLFLNLETAKNMLHGYLHNEGYFLYDGEIFHVDLYNVRFTRDGALQVLFSDHPQFNDIVCRIMTRSQTSVGGATSDIPFTARRQPLLFTHGFDARVMHVHSHMLAWRYGDHLSEHRIEYRIQNFTACYLDTMTTELSHAETMHAIENARQAYVNRLGAKPFSENLLIKALGL